MLTNLLMEMAKQSPLVLFMAVTIYFGAKFIRKTLDDAALRETCREKRYDELLDKYIDAQEQQTKAVVEALIGNTSAMLGCAEYRKGESHVRKN